MITVCITGGATNFAKQYSVTKYRLLLDLSLMMMFTDADQDCERPHHGNHLNFGGSRFVEDWKSTTKWALYSTCKREKSKMEQS